MTHTPSSTSDAEIAAVCERAISAVEFARTTTRELLDGIPEARLTHQVVPGSPHVLWILGHLAVSDEWIEGMIRPFETRLPKHYKELFGHTTSAEPDPARYPTAAEVRDSFERTRVHLMTAAREATADQLTRPLGEEGVGFASDPLDAVGKIAWHEGWHAGQLSIIRRSLGMPPVFPYFHRFAEAQSQGASISTSQWSFRILSASICRGDPECRGLGPTHVCFYSSASSRRWFSARGRAWSVRISIYRRSLRSRPSSRTTRIFCPL